MLKQAWDAAQLELFVDGWNKLAADIYSTAKDKGWWDVPRNQAEMIALMHSELSEALESLRVGNPKDDKVPEFSAVETELADVIIRIMDYSAGFGYDVPGALLAKMEYNKTRERKHGKKF